MIDARLRRLADSPAPWTVIAAIWFALRARDAWMTPQLWGEDGPIFLVRALSDPWGSVWESYAGYIHLLPRILALSAIGVPLSWVPAVYAGLAFLVTVAAMVYAATARMPSPFWCAAPLAFAIVPQNGEVVFTITNVQWITATCLALAAAAPPPRARARRNLDMVVVGVCGMTGPFSILFLPAFVLRAWFSRGDMQAWLLLAVAAATAVVQLTVLASADPFAAYQPPAWPGMAEVVYVIIGRMLGDWFAFGPSLQVRWGIVIAAGLAIALAGPLSRSEGRQPILVLGLCGGAILAAAILKFSGDIAGLLQLAPTGYGGRYYYPPGVLLAWALWIAAWDHRRVPRYAALLALGLLVANGASHGGRIPRADLRWADQVRRYEAGEIPALRIHPEGLTISPPRSAPLLAR